jgi:hypothetical protein
MEAIMIKSAAGSAIQSLGFMKTTQDSIFKETRSRFNSLDL